MKFPLPDAGIVTDGCVEVRGLQLWSRSWSNI